MDTDPQRQGSFISGSRCLCQISSKSVKNCDRESADRDTHTDTHTDRDDTGDLIICPMLCYSNGTDKNRHSALSTVKTATIVSEKGATIVAEISDSTM